jgi:tRNA dimethylallyltransferase
MDIVAPDVNFTAADFRREARHAIAEILARGRKPILVGGTGLYLKVLLQGLVDAPPADEEYRRTLREIGGSEDGGALLHDMLAALDPVTAVSLHPNDQVRIIRALEVYRQSGRPVSALRREHAFGTANYSCLKIGISVPRDELYRRIENRVDAMIADGFVGEVRGLLSAGFGRELKSINSIGYREMSEFIDGGTTLDEAVSRIKKNTRNYAKRQETWFRRDEEIYWVDYPETFATILNHVIAFYD